MIVSFSNFLNVNTPAADLSRRMSDKAVGIFLRHYPEFEYAAFGADSASLIDGVLIKGGEIKRLVEIKTRNVRMSTLVDRFNNELLLSFDKVANARELAVGMKTPVVAMMFLVPDDTLIVRKLIDPNGRFSTAVRLETTVSQAGVNGGKKVGCVAYFDMEGSCILR